MSSSGKDISDAELGLCPSTLLHDTVPDFPRATDALRVDQQAAVREFANGKRLKS